MPKAWSAKDERMYKHIQQSEREAGRSEDRAEEIAAATVNKHRREEGRTGDAHEPRKRSPDSGDSET